MPVLELAQLTLLLPAPPLARSTRAALLRAKAAMQAHSGATFAFLGSGAEPHHVFVLGAWASVDDHVRVFVPGAANQAVLRDVEGRVAVEWLAHFDVPLQGVLEVLRAGGCVLERVAVRREARSRFEEALERRGDGVGGWRVDDPGAEYLGGTQSEDEDVFVWFGKGEMEHQESESVEKPVYGDGGKATARLIDRTAVTILDLESQS